ncbi:hypothetical protein AEMCBJ_34280 (plasmid) [Cupriavidus necator]|uniref:hypothetical protein n=1 Tax=Cupriavidus necator TaxID=106590 RepID=UPI003F73A907
MANNVYPDTALQPLQTIDFILANGLRVRTMLKPQPDANRVLVGDVELDCTNAGGTRLQPMGRDPLPRTVIQAGVLAYQYAQHEAEQHKTKIVEARLEGREFLDVPDVEDIVGRVFPVKPV